MRLRRKRTTGADRVSEQLTIETNHEKSWNGYTLDVLENALRKYIRRNEVKMALYCAGEFELFRFAKKHPAGGKTASRASARKSSEPLDRRDVIRARFVKQLMLSFVEDIGPGGIEKWEPVDELLKFRKKGPGDAEHAIVKLVTILCGSSKVRLSPHIRSITNPSLIIQCSPDEFPEVFRLGRRALAEGVNSMEYPELADKLWEALDTKDWMAVWYAQALVTKKWTPRERGWTMPYEKIMEILVDFVPPKYIGLARKWYRALDENDSAYCVWMNLIASVIVDVRYDNFIGDDESDESDESDASDASDASGDEIDANFQETVRGRTRGKGKEKIVERSETNGRPPPKTPPGGVFRSSLGGSRCGVLEIDVSTFWEPNINRVMYDLDYFTRDIRKTKGKWFLSKKTRIFTSGLKVRPKSEYTIEEFESFYDTANVRKYKD